MKNKISLRPILRWFQTTQNSSFVKAEGKPNRGCGRRKKMKAARWLT